MGLFTKKSLPTDRLRVGVIGVGHLGQHHARIYNSLEQDVELIGISDIDENRAKEIAKKNSTRYYTDYRELLEAGLDAVTIAVPTVAHHQVALDCLDRAVHVLIEKPICSSLQEADDLLSAANKNEAIIQVGHVERFNPAILKLAQIVKNPKFIEVHRLAPYKPRGIDVSVVLDLMIHDLDIVLYLVNRELNRIDAVGVEVLTSAEDIANVRLSFAGGCVANITCSRVSLKEMRKIRIFQPNTYISLDYKAQEGVIYTKNGDTFDSITREVLNLAKDEPLKLEIQSFIECIKTGSRPHVSGEDGRKALQVATDIAAQIQEHKKALEQ
ncbi:MAG: Gfo/Idh/MocA family oxidoreductase [Candidatus Auribacterota bacterium]